MSEVEVMDVSVLLLCSDLCDEVIRSSRMPSSPVDIRAGTKKEDRDRRGGRFFFRRPKTGAREYVRFSFFVWGMCEIMFSLILKMAPRHSIISYAASHHQSSTAPDLTSDD